ncbi:MAG: MBL fold metallo-hydrolase [Planctomycetota bacterium]|jgi:glyoxylase-like metal-dependent hydrolase (beta-lactamase superfamily II)/rhodanese-related sulfurtransferase
MSKELNLRQFKAASCFSYILSSSTEALIIDPHISLLEEYAGYLKKKNLTLQYIIDTHTHADHFSLAAVLKKRYGASVLMHEKAISDVATKRIKDNDTLSLGSAGLKFMYTPGHTDDAVSIYAEKMIFTGDVLLIGSVGRTDFQNGSPESMFDTLKRLNELPGDTALFPGHDYHEKRSSTILKEKAANPFLKENDRDAFVREMRSKKLAKPFNIDNIIRLNQKGEAVGIEMISPRQAQDIILKDPETVFLDVRSVLEYADSNIKDSLNIPIDTLLFRIDELRQKKKKYIVFCRTGNRSPMAADMLIQSGIHGVKVMEGGMLRWQKEKMPFIKGVSGISLERQIKMIAGSLVLTGLLLSLFVHKGFIAISIFVCCGLIYAGITDNCLLGMLLMKLPYNKNMYKAKLGGGTCSIG